MTEFRIHNIGEKTRKCVKCGIELKEHIYCTKCKKKVQELRY